MLLHLATNAKLVYGKDLYGFLWVTIILKKYKIVKYISLKSILR